MILHIINKSPLQYSALYDALPYISESDCLLMIDDGVYAALPGTAPLARIREKRCRCVALHNDILVRGLTIDPSVQTISMMEFVELAFDSIKTVSWY